MYGQKSSWSPIWKAKKGLEEIITTFVGLLVKASEIQELWLLIIKEK